MRAEKKKGDVSIACFLIRWAAHCYYENGCHCFRVVIAVFRNLLFIVVIIKWSNRKPLGYLLPGLSINEMTVYKTEI
ncbi:hypothetical protein CWC33_05355 [Idiomarina sp. X4]|nr:hypothetical protein CWC33_05355 [Idiomarina sp. X4]